MLAAALGGCVTEASASEPIARGRQVYRLLEADLAALIEFLRSLR